MATRLQYLPRRGSLPPWSFRSWPLSAVRGNPVVRRDDQCAAALQHFVRAPRGSAGRAGSSPHPASVRPVPSDTTRTRGLPPGARRPLKWEIDFDAAGWCAWWPGWPRDRTPATAPHSSAIENRRCLARVVPLASARDRCACAARRWRGASQPESLEKIIAASLSACRAAPHGRSKPLRLWWA